MQGRFLFFATQQGELGVWPIKWSFPGMSPLVLGGGGNL